ncbi:methionyl-tRNA formyltransferase [Algihabitans sp.]|uniref:methionyl-tRNA formyltransferase n=1 Tax=Algihabitans sp. TaxID=2821514 RepID=UPI003BAB7D2A
MRIAIIGRTRWLLNTARKLSQSGHDIVCVATAKAEPSYGCGPDDFEALARQTGARFLGVVSLANPEVSSSVRACKPDLAVSVNWPKILGSAELDLFPQGVVNAHAGDLPRYRGNACPNWAILNGEDRIGLCAHIMTPGDVDAGPVLLRDYLKITDQTYIGDVYEWLDATIPRLFTDAINGFSTGDIEPIPQPSDPALALRCFPRRPEDGHIAWNHSVANIHRLIRASSKPFDGAFCFLTDGRRMTIWRGRPFEFPSPFCAVPGQIMVRHEGDPVVACGEGALRLELVEIEGETPTASKALVTRSVRERLA